MTFTTTFPPRRTERRVSAAGLAALGLSLRDAADADWPFLQGLFASCRGADLAPAWPQIHLEALLNDQFRLQHHHLVTHFPAADFWIVEQRDRLGADVPVGRLYLDRAAPLWRIVDIGLLPEARGRGRGAALLGWTQAAAVAAGAAGVDLHVLMSNHRAQALYRRLGFQPVDDAEGVHLRMVWEARPPASPA